MTNSARLSSSGNRGQHGMLTHAVEAAGERKPFHTLRTVLGDPSADIGR
jgi:hypothetical protein